MECRREVGDTGRREGSWGKHSGSVLEASNLKYFIITTGRNRQR